MSTLALVLALWLSGCGLLLDPDSPATPGDASADARRDSAPPADTGARIDGSRDGAVVDGSADAGPDAPSCGEVPCRLVAPQCGCAGGQACYYSGGPGCSSAGTQSADTLCDVNQDCRAGLGCISGNGDSLGICRAYCYDSADCSAGEACVALGATPGAAAGYCEKLCDPLLDTGCPAPLTCVITQSADAEDPGMSIILTGCVEPATPAPGEPCDARGACGAGATCDGSGICRLVCDVTDSACPGGTVCLDIGFTRDGRSYGICT